ncbi:helix-turn-helix domain-containing protein [Pseudonocardia hispaniensis]|uniref:Helix-turn-helix domain-containing protein n=1 Tax=Pseudonocardia hispaniensis TaxID=904933 RepID=A0ABW1IYH8_9PSEU
MIKQRRWPWPADTELERARRVARDYRDALRAVRPDLADHLDAQFQAVGQGWVNAEPAALDPDELLTAEQAAELAQVAVRTITTWRLERTPPLPSVRTPDGIRIRVGDLIAWQAARRRRRLHRTRTTP